MLHAGILKKRKVKPKATSEEGDEKKAPTSSLDESLKANDAQVDAPSLTEKILESPVTAAVAGTVAASLAAVGA